jgi:thioredoxin-related protein
VKEINEAGINSYTYIDVEQEGTEDLQEKYSVRSIPMTFLVKTNGDIINKWVGYDDEDPGQTKFVNYIRTCGYNIIPYNGEKL